MKAKVIAGILLIAAAVQADARIASPYPRKTLPPDETDHWIAINGDIRVIRGSTVLQNFLKR